jgi:hypothetical protein
MSPFLKKFRVAAIVLAITSLSQSTNADTIRIDTLVAYDLHEAPTDHDRIRIEYIVDGGKMQAVYRNMHLGDVWNVGLDITFNKEVIIQLYHKESGIIRDKKFGAHTITAGSIADGTSQVFNFTGHGSRYWLSVGRGNYVAPTYVDPPPRPTKDRWEDGGTYETAAEASAAGLALVTAGKAKKFRVFEVRKYINSFGNYLIYFGMNYVPAP